MLGSPQIQGDAKPVKKQLDQRQGNPTVDFGQGLIVKSERAEGIPQDDQQHTQRCQAGRGSIGHIRVEEGQGQACRRLKRQEQGRGVVGSVGVA